MNSNGRFNKDVFNDIDEAVEVGKEEKFDFKFIATDGDNKTNSFHTDLQNFCKSKSENFDDAVDALKDYEKLPISDPLHLLKDLKKRYLKHLIKMTDISDVINHNEEKQILEISSSYSTKVEEPSSLNSMRDDLSLMLFNTENLYLLGIHGRYPFFSFQFIIVLSIVIIQSDNLSLNARIKLCKIGYNCIHKINENSVNYQRKKIADSKYIVKFVDTNTFNRLSNNFLSYCYAFKYHGKYIQNSSLSSHPLELCFGRIRQGSNGNDTSDIALNYISKSLIRDRLLDKLGKKETPVRGRCNVAGSCYSENWNIDIP